MTIAEIRDRIEAAFAETPAPGDAFLEISATHQDEGIVEYFRGTTWRGHGIQDLRHHSAALSFFTGPAFRYWLPAFMLGSLEDSEAADVKPEGIASSMLDYSRRKVFTANELNAVAAFLAHFAELYGSDRFRRATERVSQSADNWACDRHAGAP
ncbi:DUF6714 family protein [Singulisphaera rosea]